MHTQEAVLVADLSLDLRNFRTATQKTEKAAVEAMIATSPDRFWAVVESLLESGYLPTENIIVLRASNTNAKAQLIVKEGNRRIAALKLIHRMISRTGLDVPDNISEMIDGVSALWKKSNLKVPCAVYPASDRAIVDRIVTLTHGKNEKAGRDKWNAIAGARHNREVNQAAEYGLDLLELYIQNGRNLTDRQRARWAGVYSLTVLDEAIKKIAPRIGFATSRDLVSSYPGLKHREAIESVLYDIGTEHLGFPQLRDKSSDFGTKYGLQAPTPSSGQKKGGSGQGSGGAKGAAKQSTGTQSPSGQAKAHAVTDHRAVRRCLRDFTPIGKNREKVVDLRDEAIALDIRKTPLAFCFVLRSLYEVSAKVYCDDHARTGGPKRLNAKGMERPLGELLGDIANHITQRGADKQKVKLLHGATTELARPNGLLSVTSMNQLVHNPRFSVAPGDVARLFGNILPLLEEMNA